jgi:hypothetical protein
MISDETLTGSVERLGDCQDSSSGYKMQYWVMSMIVRGAVMIDGS